LLQEFPMSMFLRLATGVGCLGVLALGIAVSDLTCPSSWDGSNRSSLAEERGREEKLKRLRDALRRRLEAKRQVAEEVIPRRQTLAEAIEQFRACDRGWPDTRFWFQTPEEVGMSKYEWDGRSVINQVQEVLVNRPAEAAEVVGRLEKELQELLAARKKRRPAPGDPRTEPSR
jgi:hypothetical protein